MKKVMLLAIAIVLSSVSYADNCARPQNTFDSLYCARKIFFSLDDELNTKYQSLMKRLDKKGKKQLKRSQLNWIRERNAQCVEGDAVIVSCAVETTRERLHFLDNRLHECKSVGCINDNLY